MKDQNNKDKEEQKVERQEREEKIVENRTESIEKKGKPGNEIAKDDNDKDAGSGDSEEESKDTIVKNLFPISSSSSTLNNLFESSKKILPLSIGFGDGAIGMNEIDQSNILKKKDQQERIDADLIGEEEIRSDKNNNEDNSSDSDIDDLLTLEDEADLGELLKREIVNSQTIRMKTNQPKTKLVRQKKIENHVRPEKKKRKEKKKNVKQKTKAGDSLKSFKYEEVNGSFSKSIQEMLQQMGGLSDKEMKNVSNRATRRVFEEWTIKGKPRGISVLGFMTPTRRMKIQKLFQRYINTSSVKPKFA